MEEKYKNLTQLDYKDFLWCWEINYYDGMLSAIAFYNKNPVYVSCTTDTDPVVDPNDANFSDPEYLYYPRIFTVYKLTQDDFQNEFYRNLMWKKYVGFHLEMDPARIKRPFAGMVRKDDLNWDAYTLFSKNNPFRMDLSNPIGFITIDNKDPDKSIE